MSSFNFDLILQEKPPTRDRHLIRLALEEALDAHCITETRMKHVWELIDELENAAYEGGMDEGYEYGEQSCMHVEQPV